MHSASELRGVLNVPQYGVVQYWPWAVDRRFRKTFWRRKRIREDAHALGDMVLALGNDLDRLSFDAFVEAARRRGLKDNYVDVNDRTCGFYDSYDAKGRARFAFHADF